MKIKVGKGKMTAESLAALCGGTLHGDPQTEFSFICTDSREADGKTLFVAMRGERVDGHDFADRAIGAGCPCLLCERIPEACRESEAAFVTVSDSVAALSRLAANACRSKKRKTVATNKY